MIFTSTALNSLAGPGMIQYQGRLTNSAGNPITTPIAVTFTFWSAATGGTQLGGTFYDLDTIMPNSQGLFTAIIGDETGAKIPESIFNSPQVWLNVKIGSENLSPRKQLVAVAYAFRSSASDLATTATAALTAKFARYAAWSDASDMSTVSELSTMSYMSERATTATTALSARAALQSRTSDWATTATAALSARAALQSHMSDLATTATTALSAKFAPESDTLASVTGRGASSTDLLTLSGGVRAATISPLVEGGSVLVNGIDMQPDGISLPAVAPPVSPANKLYHANGRLYWNGMPLMPAIGDGFVIVQTTADPVANAANLVAAYGQAKAMRPHAQDLSTSNRLTIFVPPGRYELTSNQLTLDADFIDLIGLSTARADQHLFGILTTDDSGLLRQTANDVRIENLTVSGDTIWSFITKPAAYCPDAGTTDTIIRNCEFTGRGQCTSMRTNVAYPGRYENCRAGNDAFGSYGAASGTFIDCVAGNNSFGYGSIASGTFIRCTALATSFGGTASGRFIDCMSGNSSFGLGGPASGTFINCTAADYGFGSYYAASGVFNHCTAGNMSFAMYGTASGKFTDCTAGVTSFGSYGAATGTFTNCTASHYSFGLSSVVSGTFTNCTAGNSSFGAGNGSLPSTVSGTFVNCKAGESSFGAHMTYDMSDTVTTVAATFIGCTGSHYSFGGGNRANTTNTIAAKLKDCRMDGTVWAGTWSGIMQDCVWNSNLNCAETARVYNSTIAGTLDLKTTAAGVTQSRARSIINAQNNVFGGTDAAALNIASFYVK